LIESLLSARSQDEVGTSTSEKDGLLRQKESVNRFKGGELAGSGGRRGREGREGREPR
jgi:hypothetical protein